MNAPLSFRRYAKLIERRSWLVAREEPGPGYGRTGEGVPGPEVVEDWQVVHARVVELGVERAGHEREVCRWLLAAERLGVHTRAGHASLREYADWALGLRGRQTEERLRVGRALAGLPALDEALATGELCWSVVRELSRVATAETEEGWQVWAKGRRCREVEQAVAARHRGEGPADPGDPRLVKHNLRFEVRAETMALFRDAQAAVRADLGGDTDDDMLLYEMARRVLAGPGDEGRASYQVAVTRCEDCGRASIDAGGTSHSVDDLFAEMAACDAQHLGGLGGAHPSAHAGATTYDEAPTPKGESKARRPHGASPQTGAPTPAGESRARSTRGASSHTVAPTPAGESRARSTRAARAASPHMGAPAPEHTSQARTRAVRAPAPDHTGAPAPEPTRLAQNTRSAGAGASPRMGAPSPKRARAAQSIPPATRREVLRRDRRRCVVPGCQNHIFLDVHHLDPRAEGGDHHPDRLATLCGGHHRSVHLGNLCIEGTGSAGFIVRHGDGTPYGQTPSPARLHLTSLALGALQHMGFKATEARELVDAVLSLDPVPDDPGDFVRAALRATS